MFLCLRPDASEVKEYISRQLALQGEATGSDLYEEMETYPDDGVNNLMV